MRYIKFYENFTDNKQFLKEKIDWKLVKYLGDILTTYWDKGISIDLKILINDYILYREGLNKSGNTVGGFFNGTSPDKWWAKRVANFNSGKKIFYSINFTITEAEYNNLEYDDSEDINIFRGIIKEVDSRLKEKYDFKNVNKSLDSGIQFSNYKLK